LAWMGHRSGMRRAFRLTRIGMLAHAATNGPPCPIQVRADGQSLIRRTPGQTQQEAEGKHAGASRKQNGPDNRPNAVSPDQTVKGYFYQEVPVRRYPALFVETHATGRYLDEVVTFRTRLSLDEPGMLPSRLPRPRSRMNNSSRSKGLVSQSSPVKGGRPFVALHPPGGVRTRMGGR
jgi:hypothetical protein